MKQYLPVLFFIATTILITFPNCKQADQVADSLSTELPFFKASPEFVEEREVSTLAIGEPAPDFNLPATDGKFYTLSDFDQAKILVIVFTCNHCPTAQAYEERIIKIASDYTHKGVQVVAISPNSPLGLLYEELGYSDLNDDFEDMKLRVEHMNYNFPYLYDGDNEEVSLQYGPVATPHSFVFDAERKLQYVGRIDKFEKPGTGNAEDIRSAIDALLLGEIPSLAVTKTFGCSTKWGWKTKLKSKVDQEWSEKEVSLNDIDEAGIENLLRNEDSSKLRLINVWATWCGPCVLEYPEFVTIQRMFGARDFEFISISADKVGQKNKALKFLIDKQSAVTNYIFDKEDKYALIEAIDKDWNGALPYTILIEPGGNIVWKHQGVVDFLALKRAIVDHPMIGRYF